MKHMALAVALFVSLAAPTWGGVNECKDGYWMRHERCQALLSDCVQWAELGDGGEAHTAQWP